MWARMPLLVFVAAAMSPSRTEIAAEVAAQVARRGAGKTLCPSEVARTLASDWRSLMPEVRAVAAEMAARGELRVTQKGVEVDVTDAKGPIRFGIR